MKTTKFVLALIAICAIVYGNGSKSFARGLTSSQKTRVAKPKTNGLVLKIGSVGAREVRLEWQNPAPQEIDYYDVSRSTNPNFVVSSTRNPDFFRFHTLRKNLIFVDPTVKPNTRYFYRVVASSPNGLVLNSNLVAVKTTPLPIPPKIQPVALKLDGISPLRVVSLLWTPYKGKDFSHYNIYRSYFPHFVPDDDKTLWDQQGDAAKARTTDIGIMLGASLNVSLPENYPGTTAQFPKIYYYKVVVFLLDGRKGVSNELKVVLPTPSTKPPTPSLLSLKSVFNKRATLEWTECKEPDAIAYQLHRSLKSGFIPSRSTLVNGVIDPESKTKWEDKDLKAQTKYFYKVVTLNVDSLSFESNELAIETSAPPAPELAPAPVVLQLAAPPTFDSVPLQWTKSNDPNFDAYEIHLLDKPTDEISPDNISQLLSDVNETHFVDGALTEGKLCYYVVVVRNKFDQTAVSNVIETTTRQHQMRPIVLTAQAGYSNMLTLKWSGQYPDGTGTHPVYHLDAGTYMIYRGSKPGFLLTKKSLLIDSLDGNATEWTDQTVESGKTYFYKIVYVANNGQTLASNEAKVVQALD